MAARFLFSFMLASLLALVSLHGAHAVQFFVINRALNTSGGLRFQNELGSNYTQQKMRVATDFIWHVFNETTPADRKNVKNVSLFVENIPGIAHAVNNEIFVAAKYIESIKGDIKPDFNGVLYHEMTHIWQHYGSHQAPVGLLEGIADFVRLKANYVPHNWAKPGEGLSWKQGSSVTARFLDYCNGLHPQQGFVAKLNKKMRVGYSDNIFHEQLGKTVDQLWTDYKAKFKTN